MKKLLYGVAVLACLGTTVQANATPVTFGLTPASTVLLTSFEGWGGAPTLVYHNLTSQGATLNAGDTWTMDLLSIAFPLVGGGKGTVSALLGIDVLGPNAPAAPDVANSAKGSFWSFFLNAGELTWATQPGLFSLSDGTQYTVAFENLSGVTLGRSVDVHAFLTLHSEPVPEPGTMALLALGMLGVMFASRRQLLARKT